MKNKIIIILFAILLLGCAPRPPHTSSVYYGINNISDYTIKVIVYYKWYDNYVKEKEETVIQVSEKQLLKNFEMPQNATVPIKLEFYKMTKDTEKLCHIVEVETHRELMGFDDGVVYEDRKLREHWGGGELPDDYFYYLSPKPDSDIWK